MTEALLNSLILTSALLHILAEYLGPRFFVYFLKPLTTFLIFLVAFTVTDPPSLLYQYLICAGLLFSLGGDIFLMLPADRFVPGLVSFLLAHLCYLVAFLTETGLRFSLWRMVPFLIYGVVVYSILSPHLRDLKGPVAVYMFVILAMVWLSCERWAVGVSQRSARLAFAGALLFVTSDTALAVARFKGRYSMAHALILSTYYGGQWMIARSVAAG